MEVSDNILFRTSELMVRRAQDIIDFDNHLDDITLDWWNSSLNNEIDSEDST